MSKKNYDRFIQDLLEFIKTKETVHSSDIPNIELYMDQVTTFMDEHLGLFKRSGDEKILTKTMINNYSKSGILPPTNRKKYSNDHMVLLLFVYYFKNILSIPDIKILLEPVKDSLLGEDAPISTGELLDRIMDVQAQHYDSMAAQVNHTVDISKTMFEELEPEIAEKLSIFTTAYLLTIQATAQKHMAVQLIDQYLKNDKDETDKPKGESGKSKKEDPKKKK